MWRSAEVGRAVLGVMGKDDILEVLCRGFSYDRIGVNDGDEILSRNFQL